MSSTQLPSVSALPQLDQHRSDTSIIAAQRSRATRLVIMSLRIVPEKAHPSETKLEVGAPSAPGVHDVLRSRMNLAAPAPTDHAAHNVQVQSLQSSHPLEARLKSWRKTQDDLKMSLLRRQFGLAEPVKRQMELDICRAGDWRPACLGAAGRSSGNGGVQADILSGRDTEIDWEDIYVGSEMEPEVTFHAELEARMRMNW